MKYFYEEIIEIESVLIELDELELKDEHKKHLAKLVDSTIHHTVLDIILSKLPQEEKAVFLARLKNNPRDKELRKFLNTKVEGIEKDIKEAVEKLKKELHEDIKEAKKR